MILGLTNTSSQSTGNTERRAGVLLFAGLYIVLVAITVLQWNNRYRLMKYRKQVGNCLPSLLHPRLIC